MSFKSIKRVKLILPALTEATSPYWRPIKYSLFPPLGLATLAAYADWKKFERAWDLVIRVRQLSQMRPILEAVLSSVGSHKEKQPGAHLTPIEIASRNLRNPCRLVQLLRQPESRTADDIELEVNTVGDAHHAVKS